MINKFSKCCYELTYRPANLFVWKHHLFWNSIFMTELIIPTQYIFVCTFESSTSSMYAGPALGAAGPQVYSHGLFQWNDLLKPLQVWLCQNVRRRFYFTRLEQITLAQDPIGLKLALPVQVEKAHNTQERCNNTLQLFMELDKQEYFTTVILRNWALKQLSCHFKSCAYCY